MKTIFTKKNLSAVAATVLCVQFAASQSASYQGNFSGTNFENVPISGSSASWSNMPNANFFDGSSATNTLLSANEDEKNTDFLKASSFLFSIPPTSIISGIEVTVYKNSNERNKTKDNIVAIVKNNVTGNDNHALKASWQAQANPAIYGSSNDLWGQTWSPADINAAGFGAAISVKRKGKDSLLVSIDAILIKVYYTAADSNIYYGGNSGASLRIQEQVLYNNSHNSGELNVFPNPYINGNINIDISTIEIDKPILVILSDVTGREYYSKVLTSTDGKILEISNSSTPLVPGVYLITATSNDVFLRKKLVAR